MDKKHVSNENENAHLYLKHVFDRYCVQLYNLKKIKLLNLNSYAINPILEVGFFPNKNSNQKNILNFKNIK